MGEHETVAKAASAAAWRSFMFVLYRRNAERERLCALLVASVPNLKPALYARYGRSVVRSTTPKLL
jgi:hypothetical protein